MLRLATIKGRAVTGYRYRGSPSAPGPGFPLLTATEFAQMRPEAKAKRQADWKGVVRGLQFEHDRLYHSHADALAEALQAPEVFCEIEGCQGRRYAWGLCRSDYRKARRRERQGAVA